MRRSSVAARVAASAVVVAVVVASGLAYASEVTVAVVDTTAPTGEVSVEQGASVPITINLSVKGSQEGTATFEVFRNWTLSGGSFTGSNPQEFVVQPRSGGPDATTFSTTGTITVATAQPTGGPFTLAVKAFDITNSNTSGAKLVAGEASSYKVTVLAGGDTAAPVLSLPGDIVAQATGPAGAAVTYTASATDAVDGTVPVTCTPASGSTFAIGPTTVNCSAKDKANNVANGSFKVTVVDTAPVLSLPADVVAEATGPSGAAVTYVTSATDAVDGSVPVTCTPASGSTFPLGQTTVECSATDASGNTATGTFKVSVVDTTAPGLSLPGDITKEATGPGGATVSYAVSASDAVSGAVTPICSPASDSTFGLGQTTVNCSATDGAGRTANGSFKVTVQDTTGPTITVANLRAEATGPDGAVLTYSPTANDEVSGAAGVECTPASGSTFPLGQTTVTCTAVDDQGNKGEAAFVVTVSDTTEPTLLVPGDMVEEATGPSGATVAYSASASDDVSGPLTPVCSPASEATFPLGQTTVECSATDGSNNTGRKSFKVTVQDTTPPSLTLPEDMTVEATGPNGAAASWTATAIDLVSGSVSVTCTAAPGSTFALGETTVECSATDGAGKTANGSFTVTVEDTTPPALTLPDDTVVQATGPDGAVASWTASANDVVSGPVAVDCTPTSDSTFPLGETTVECSAVDDAGNEATSSFKVTVVDTTPPTLTLPSGVTKEATGPNGAVVTYSASASDLVSGVVAVDCAPASGSTFALGQTTVACSATDGAGNKATSSFKVTVADTTPPALTLPSAVTQEATGPAGAVVTYPASASDLVSGPVAVDCAPASGSTFALGSHTVDCSATDASGNKAERSFTVTVQDKTKPTLSLPASIATSATSASGAVVPYSTSAGDVVDTDVAVVCSHASGSVFVPGQTTVNCSATDDSGNTAAGSFTVTVTFSFPGFRQPVDNKILNGMKAGSTAPIKWQVPDGNGGFISSTSIVTKALSGSMPCAASTPVDNLEEYATGSTTLRYDTSSESFVYNWQSPKKPGTCYKVVIVLTDGTTHAAAFQLK